MQVLVRGTPVQYDFRPHPLMGEDTKQIRRARVAREDVGLCLRDWLSFSRKDIAYVTVAVSMFQRAIEAHSDPDYWLQIRGKPCGDMLVLWAKEQHIVIERRARAHRRAMLVSVR